METINLLLHAVLSIAFYLLGRYSTKQDKVTIQKIKKTFKRKRKPKAGVYTFKTQEELENIKNGDKELEKTWLKSGLLDKIKGND